MGRSRRGASGPATGATEDVYVRFPAPGLVLALEYTGRNDLAVAEFLFADRALAGDTRRGFAVGAAGDFHDFVFGGGGKYHGVDALAGSKGTPAKWARLAAGGRRWWHNVGLFGQKQAGEQNTDNEGKKDGHQDFCHGAS